MSYSMEDRGGGGLLASYLALRTVSIGGVGLERQQQHQEGNSILGVLGRFYSVSKTENLYINI